MRENKMIETHEAIKLLENKGYHVTLKGCSVQYADIEDRRQFLRGIIYTSSRYPIRFQHAIANQVQISLGAATRSVLVEYFKERGDYSYSHKRNLTGTKRRYYGKYHNKEYPCQKN